MNSTDDALPFPDRLRRARVAARLTQEQLAERAGLSARSVSQLERGRVRYPRPESVRLLGEALGLSPGDQQEFAESARAARWEEQRPAVSPRPAQLPGDVIGFSGRTRELGHLDALFTQVMTAPAPVIGVVSGTAGVGKSALTLHWAHRVAGRFPDGHLFADLRGFAPSGPVADPGEVLRGFLEALSVAPGQIPASPAGQAALYRSLLAGRRMLIVLDNAHDSDQVRPLLPGAPGCLTVVTSRRQLTSLLATANAETLSLDVLSPADARALLARRLGEARLAAEPAAVAGIVAACGGLPLALAVAAARARESGLPLAALAEDLELGTLDAGDPLSNVRAVFSWSYAALPAGAARLFRLLGLHPGPDVSAAAAAALAGLPGVRPTLTELTRANLLREHRPGRYVLHDLLRAYALELGPAEPAAVTRLLDHYTRTAHTAERLMHPERDPIPLPLRGAAEATVDDEKQAAAWFNDEQAAVLAVIGLAARVEDHERAWQLAWSVESHLETHGRWPELAAVSEAALTAGQALGDPSAEAYGRKWLAHAHTRTGRYAEARAQLAAALALFTAADDRIGEARAHHGLASLADREGDHEAGVRHATAALGIYRAVGHRHGEMHALNDLGWAYALIGDHRAALTHCGRALELLEEAGDREGQAYTWDSLGYAEHHLGEYGRAIDCYERSIALFGDLDDQRHGAEVFGHLGDTLAATGDRAAARDAYRRALHVLTDADPPAAAVLRDSLEKLLD